MFKSLTIWNFQIHRFLHIVFDRITTLTGSSQKGKTAVLRALRWLMFNKPTGNAFVRHGAKFTKVKLVTEDHTIIRKKKGNDNTYILDGKVFKAFGAGVPEEIAQILNISDLQLQRQLDPHFLLSKSPGEVSKELNQTINLGLIDSTMSNLASELRKARSVQSVTRERLIEAEEQADSLKWTTRCDEHLKIVEEKEKKLEAIARKEQRLKSLLDETYKYQSAKETAELVAEAIVGDLRRVEVLNKKLAKLATRESRLRELVEEIEHLGEQQCLFNTQLERAEADLKRMLQDHCPVCGRSMT